MRGTSMYAETAVHHDLYRRAVDGGACAQTTTVDGCTVMCDRLAHAGPHRAADGTTWSSHPQK